MASTEINAPTGARISRYGAPAAPEVTRVLYERPGNPVYRCVVRADQACGDHDYQLIDAELTSLIGAGSCETSPGPHGTPQWVPAAGVVDSAGDLELSIPKLAVGVVLVVAGTQASGDQASLGW